MTDKPKDELHWYKVNYETPQSAFYRKPYRKPGRRRGGFVHGDQPERAKSSRQLREAEEAREKALEAQLVRIRADLESLGITPEV